MLRRTGLLAVVASLFLALPAPLAAQENSLEGAWRIVQINPINGDPLESPQPGLILFTGTHYSYTATTTDELRAEFSNPDEPTDAEKLRAYDTFTSQAGRYEVEGDTLITRPYVHMVPNYMNSYPEIADKSAYSLDGDTLRIDFLGLVVITMRRVEAEPPPY